MKIKLYSSDPSDIEIKSSKYLSLRRTAEGYDYIHDKMHGLANVLGYRQHSTHPFLIRVEPNSVVPSGMIRTLIGGGIEEGEDPIVAARRELLEESGYDVEVPSLTYLGRIFFSKNCDLLCDVFACDLTGTPSDIPETDGTPSEAVARNFWVTPKVARDLIHPIVQYALVQAACKVPNFPKFLP